MTTQTKAVVDRITNGNQAVILAESINKEFILNTNETSVTLREGLWLDITISKGHITSIKANEALTKEKSQAITNKLNRLKQKKGSKYKQ